MIGQRITEFQEAFIREAEERAYLYDGNFNRTVETIMPWWE